MNPALCSNVITIHAFHGVACLPLGQPVRDDTMHDVVHITVYPIYHPLSSLISILLSSSVSVFCFLQGAEIEEDLTHNLKIIFNNRVEII